MLELFLLRHADAAWVQGCKSDFARSLSEKGQNESILMGGHLARQGISADRALCSTALRVRQTVECIAPAIGLEASNIQFADEIYEATVTQLLGLIRGTQTDIRRLLLVGHNPGLSELPGYLCARPVPHLPTCGFAHIQLNQAGWQDTGLKRGHEIAALLALSSPTLCQAEGSILRP